MKSRFWFPVLLIAAAMGCAAVGKAQNKPGVARVSIINGSVSMQRGDAGEWVGVTENTPLEPGDSISTAQNARSEVQLDYADVLRMAGSTDAKIATLDNSNIQVQVAQGLVDFTVLKGGEAQVEIDTPNVAVHPLEPGVYRIEVNSQSETRVIVRHGKAQVSTQQGSANLDPNRMMTVQGSENPQYQITEAPAKDGWDGWNNERNHQIQDAQSWHHDNSYYTGTQDLDAYGHWQYVPGYDWCWTPYIDAGWVPYSSGQWVWEPYYGWTWVSQEPWGWAPYHYGRWFYYGSSWLWWPGPVTPYYHPIWAPAYVSFFGFGGGGFNLSVGFGFGRVGWLPVGPCDPYFPWYGRGRFGYDRFGVNNFNQITNVTYIRNITRGGRYPYISPLAGRGRPIFSNYQAALHNPGVRRAIMTMPANRFGTAQAFHGRSIGITGAQFRQASFVSGRVPLVPTRASLSASARPVSRASLPSAAVTSRRFFMTRQPAARVQPFSQQVARMQSLVRNNNTSLAARPNSRTPAQFSRAQTAPQGRTTAFGPARTNSFSRQPAPNNGWQRFGTPAARGSYASRQPSNARQPSTRTPLYTNNSRIFNSSKQTRRPGWRTFSSSPNGAGYRSPSSNARTPAPRSFSPRSVAPTSNANRGGWQRFSARSTPTYHGNNSPRPVSRGTTGATSHPGWRAFSGGGQKPPLQLSRPIVTGRSSGYSNYRGSWGRGYSSPTRSAPSYSRGGGGGYHGGGAPRGGGGYHGGGAPRGGGGYHGGGAPHGGGGYHGGGAPHGGGGYHGGGAPHGGGGRGGGAPHGGGGRGGGRR